MSSSRRDERSSANQDFIAKIRYGNYLPPPSNPPKLLNIANDALSTYCKVEHTTRLARENFHTVETDVESGMPLDVWGLPGVFDGDDSAMLAQDAPALHPDDKELLIPLNQIGRKSATPSTGPVSFLRRTEYISGRETTKRGSRHGSGLRHETRKPTETFDEHDPVTMLSAILKSFDTANPSTADPSNRTLGSNDPRLAEAEKQWNNPTHPRKKNVKLVTSFPLFPDFGAGDFHSIRFNAPPVPPSKHRDDRLDLGLFNIHEDKTGNSLFDYYLPDKSVPTSKIRAVFSVPPPPNVESLPGGSEERPIPYNRVREYESIRTQRFTEPGSQPEYTLVFHDDEETGKKAAYYYPLQTKMTLAPKRNDVVMNAMFRGKSEAGRGVRDPEEEPKADVLKITVREMTEEEKARRERNPLEDEEDAEGEVDE